MKSIMRLLLGLSVTTVATYAIAGDQPAAPANLKEAESQGLSRVSGVELKTMFPGVMKYQGDTGKSTMVYNADGSVLRKAFKDMTGKWRVEEGKDVYCLAFQFKKGYQDNCFAVFRAPDGKNYFDYDVESGFYSHVWRKSEDSQ